MVPEPLGVVLTTHARSRTAEAIVRFLTLRSIRVLVTVANATRNSSSFVNATTWHLPYNNFDSTGLMAVYESHEKAREAIGKAFFYLHDTVLVNDTFVRQLFRTEPRMCALTKHPSMNMGVYTVEAVYRHGGRLYATRSRPFPSSFEYLQLLKTQAVGQEDAVFRAARCRCILSSKPVIEHVATGARRRERFSKWGLVKMKANWKWSEVWVLE